jgi:Protein of unknown function (DUF1592)/Protein of unknown function (DUF1588)/Protein of unknown function (DUF1585)/Protein of unknown function (DUF1595)/Protein of unknown function (DUF1587)
MRRLNAVEYDNTLRELLGITSRPSTALPPDALGTVFFNDAAALAPLTPEHIEKLFSVSETAVREALERNRAGIVTCDPAGANRTACTREILTRIVGRAYRRPAEPTQIDRLLELSQQGADFDEGLRLALRAVIGSPSFLYRTVAASGSTESALDPFELASQLSYFLWSTSPDASLYAQASSGQLTQERVLRLEVARMLKDPRGRALVDHFAVQWLGLDRLASFTPDAAAFPDFSDALRSDMLTETDRLFRDILDQDRAAMTVLSADYTFVNERLARHYGISGVTGPDFRRVPLAGLPRKGLLTHASILATTSHPDGTSIPRRGTWVRTNLLCQPPPPPPKDVPATPVPPGFQGTRRQLVEMHRADPACAGCHSLIDPLGFGLENYDLVGRYRLEEQGAAIDNEGMLPDGRRFRGALELVALLESDVQYRRCVASKVLTYALGREVTDADACTIDQVAKAVGAGSWSDVITAVALSSPFRMQAQGGQR